MKSLLVTLKVTLKHFHEELEGGPSCQDRKTGENKSYLPPFRTYSVPHADGGSHVGIFPLVMDRDSALFAMAAIMPRKITL